MNIAFKSTGGGMIRLHDTWYEATHIPRAGDHVLLKDGTSWYVVTRVYWLNARQVDVLVAEAGTSS